MKNVNIQTILLFYVGVSVRDSNSFCAATMFVK